MNANERVPRTRTSATSKVLAFSMISTMPRLLKQNAHAEAQPVLESALRMVYGLAKANPAYQPKLAATLNNLATLYSATHQRERCEQAYREALQIQRHLAESNPAAYQPDLGATLNNLASLYSATKRPHESEQAYQEALQLYRRLAKSNPAVYQPCVAETLNNLAILYAYTDRLEESEKAYQEAR